MGPIVSTAGKPWSQTGSRSARGLAAVCIALALASGCGRRDAAEAPQPQPVETAPELPPAPPPRPPPYQDPPSWRRIPPRPPNEDPARDIFDPQAEAKKPRDFSAELQRMLGGASTCLAPRPRESGAAISVQVTAYVMPSGSVSRGEVNGGSLQPEERACLRGQLESLQFGPPIENAPMSVMASLQLSPKLIAMPKQDAPKTDGLGMIVTQAPSGEGVTPGIVPPETPGVVPPADPGVPIQGDQGVVPTPDPPAEVLR